jgi:hypothetical protein
MVQKLDKKFSGIVVRDKDGTIVSPDQYVIFLAKDNAVPQMLDAYYDECRRLGADGAQLDAVAGLINDVLEWRRRNKEKCKVPDTDPAEIE